MAWNYSNTSTETTLSGTITAGSTTITLASMVGLPASFPYTLILDFGTTNVEVVTVTGLAGSNLTVVRGQDGTAAQSHNAGARVVHGVVARDVREPQQHIDATANVHGVGASASVVGTDTVQTLTNKTMSGASNTFSGIPAAAVTGPYTDVITEPSGPAATSLEVHADAAQTGEILRVLDSLGNATITVNSTGNLFINFDKKLLFGMLAPTSTMIDGLVFGDTNKRFAIDASGKISWGSGSAVADTNLYRASADLLKTDNSLDVLGQITVARPTAAENSLRAQVQGDTVSRFAALAGGTLEWGPGGASSRDTNLYRGGSNLLKTDDVFEALSLQVIESSSGNAAITTKATADAQPRFIIDASGRLNWGPGSAGTDTNLYRSAANTLKTDDNLVIKTHKALYGESGTESVSFTNQSNVTVPVTFATPFTATPKVFTNIDTSPGATSGWHARAISITTTGFSLHVSGPNTTWAGQAVGWMAVAV